MRLPGFTAGRSLPGNRRRADGRGAPPPQEDGVVPASYWGWWDSSCGWNCTPQFGKRQIRAVLYDIPWGWDWSAACSSAWGAEKRPPDSCKIGMFGPPPGYVVEGQWWIPWTN